MVKVGFLVVTSCVFLTFCSQKSSGIESIANQKSILAEILDAIRSSVEYEDLTSTSKNFKADADKILGYTEVLTSKGTIKGQLNPYSFSFFSIKYAEAPIGKNR